MCSLVFILSMFAFYVIYPSLSWSVSGSIRRSVFTVCSYGNWETNKHNMIRLNVLPRFHHIHDCFLCCPSFTFLVCIWVHTKIHFWCMQLSVVEKAINTMLIGYLMTRKRITNTRESFNQSLSVDTWMWIYLTAQITWSWMNEQLSRLGFVN